MHGLLLIDKPMGISSHDVVRRVRRRFKTRKVGHAGTLDPLATGVLPVAIGEATKLLQFLLAENKSYRAVMRLGEATDTLDAEGVVLSRHPIPEDIFERLPDVLKAFQGKIDQIPPMYSAIKKDGVPLYKLARAGKTIERESRQVDIERLELLAVDLPDMTIEVDCSKGTDIRTLCDDIGHRLGCGAHITALRRLRTGVYPLQRCLTLEQIETEADVCLSPAFLSLDEALYEYPRADLIPNAAQRLKNGIPPQVSELLEPPEYATGSIIRLFSEGHLMAMTRYAPERCKERRGDFEIIRGFNWTPQED